MEFNLLDDLDDNDTFCDDEFCSTVNKSIINNNRTKRDDDKREIINYLQNIDYLRNNYLVHKKLKVDNILDGPFADVLYNFALTDKEWVLSTGITRNKYEKKDIPEFANINHLQIKNVQNAFREDQFSYIFYRNMHNKKCSYVEFLIRRALSSDKFINFLNSITGLNLSMLKTMFLSKYKSGNFLSPHSDKGNGRVAFVINLSKFWKPHYGGNLHFLNNNRTEIIETFAPGYNNLIIFEVPEYSGIPHFVSHVAPNIKYPRIAITGWYD